MSFYNTYKSWEDLMDYLRQVDPPQCFTVNYLPEKDEYAIWIGNQPYYNYEKLIELEQREKNELRKKIKSLQEELKSLKERYQDRVNDIDSAKIP